MPAPDSALLAAFVKVQAFTTANQTRYGRFARLAVDKVALSTNGKKFPARRNSDKGRGGGKRVASLLLLPAWDC